MGLSSWFRSATPSDAEVRAEIWSLGARHLGYPLDGALGELKAPGITMHRAQLLRACIRQMQRR